MESRMTAKQAIEEGFEFCGTNGHEFQALQYITDLDQNEIESGDYRLFSKETVCPCIDRDSLIDKAIDEAYDSLDFHVDTSDVRETVKESVDWESITNQINEALQVHTFHLLTDIKLIS
ncbi:hypothetical protein [Dyadobacter sp. CY347]|uniref:hypothetical protein n=1 Tax=Dyadobacter sp. CY347 TaxID=2909336 RepID=UPI001F1DF16B|nr:hypothetical protein [Dyadobacter sp. CY347]MCF2487480.1 hypothetical protein [Dyadobacter sp. CY347]